MPEAFDRCRANGGKIFTESKGNKYRHYCSLNGKKYYGYWKKKKRRAK